jgi:pilus assembly protein CpaB
VSSITPDISSLVLSANLPPGQLLLRPMLVTAAQATSGGALAIPKGMVAVTLPLCLPAAVAGYVQPGAEVAVFDTFSRSKSVQGNCNGSGSSQSTGGGLIQTRIVLPRVQVLSVGAAPSSGTNGTSGTSVNSTAAPASTNSSPSGQVLVTLAVDQANAERLILLTETGVSYLALLTASSQTGFDTTAVPLFQQGR